ncbi:hypothetical protein evm_008841 [Chilo suppressalis]|nr:hypothetical protein evm_008841 [Chilo suppressalis]
MTGVQMLCHIQLNCVLTAENKEVKASFEARTPGHANFIEHTKKTELKEDDTEIPNLHIRYYHSSPDFHQGRPHPLP